MNKGNTLHTVFTNEILIAVTMFMTACGMQQSDNSAPLSIATPSITASRSVSARVDPTLEKAFSENAIDRISITILNSKHAVITSINVTSKSGNVSVKVPSNEPLIVEGNGFYQNKSNYKGTVKIDAIKPGGTASATLILQDQSQQINQVNIDIGINTNQKPSNKDSQSVLISGNNQFVLFDSASSNLVNNDTNNHRDLFLRKLSDNSIINIHTSATGQLANSDALPNYFDISDDGKWIVFTSLATNLTDDIAPPFANVFLKNTNTNEIRLISRPRNSDSENPLPLLAGNSIRPRISGNGAYVVFYSDAELLAQKENGLYLYNVSLDSLQHISNNARNAEINNDGSQIVFVANNTIEKYTISSGITDPLISSEAPNSFEFILSNDGHFVIFSPYASFSFADQTLEAYQLYRYDTALKTFETVSAYQDKVTLVNTGNAPRHPNISSNGRYITFVFNGVIYIKDMISGNLLPVQQGFSPTLDQNGFKIGYVLTLDNHVYTQINPFLTGNAIPQEVKATPGDSKISVSWAPVPGAESYFVYYSHRADFTKETFDPESGDVRVSTNAPEFVLDDISNGEAYFAFVTSIRNDSESSESAQVAAAAYEDWTDKIPYDGGMEGFYQRFISIGGLKANTQYELKATDTIGIATTNMLFSVVFCFGTDYMYYQSCPVTSDAQGRIYVELTDLEGTRIFGLSVDELPVTTTSQAVIESHIDDMTVKYHKFSGLTPNAIYYVTLSNISVDLDLLSFTSNFSFSNNCFNSYSIEDEQCFAKSDDKGNIFVGVSALKENGGSNYKLSVTLPEAITAATEYAVNDVSSSIHNYQFVDLPAASYRAYFDVSYLTESSGFKSNIPLYFYLVDTSGQISLACDSFAPQDNYGEIHFLTSDCPPDIESGKTLLLHLDTREIPTDMRTNLKLYKTAAVTVDAFPQTHNTTDAVTAFQVDNLNPSKIYVATVNTKDNSAVTPCVTPPYNVNQLFDIYSTICQNTDQLLLNYAFFKPDGEVNAAIVLPFQSDMTKPMGQYQLYFQEQISITLAPGSSLNRSYNPIEVFTTTDATPNKAYELVISSEDPDAHFRMAAMPFSWTEYVSLNGDTWQNDTCGQYNYITTNCRIFTDAGRKNITTTVYAPEGVGKNFTLSLKEIVPDVIPRNVIMPYRDQLDKNYKFYKYTFATSETADIKIDTSDIGLHVRVFNDAFNNHYPSCDSDVLPQSTPAATTPWLCTSQSTNNSGEIYIEVSTIGIPANSDFGISIRPTPR